MDRSLMIALGIALALTLILEAGFYLIVCKKRNKKDLLLVILVNILTNPIVVLSYWLIVLNTSLNTTLVKIPLEIFAVVTEGYIYSKYAVEIKHPYIFSLAANIFSFSVGVLIQQFF